MRYPRNMQGYGGRPPAADWPGGAQRRRAVRPELRGGRRELASCTATPPPRRSCPRSPAPQPWPGQRHWNMESIYEYGARAGFWRLHELFTARDVPVTIYGVASALARSPAQVAAMQEAGWEIASPRAEVGRLPRRQPRGRGRRHGRGDPAAHRGQRASGRAAGTPAAARSTPSISSTEEGGFDYVSDTYDDDLPYWREHDGRQQLIIPYTLDANDMRFAIRAGLHTTATTSTPTSRTASTCSTRRARPARRR